MELNSDFAARATVHAADIPWVTSPMPGVHRRMLDRIGGEVARATTIVRYAPESKFSAHVHTGGEEFFVLDGVFQDEHGDYPAGCYIRNPPQSKHTPGSAPGCVIFVKLWQFEPADRTHVRIDTNKMAYVPDPSRAGVEVMPLFNDGREDVRLERYAAGARVTATAAGGMELLVLTGTMVSADEPLKAQSWQRLPIGAMLEATAGRDGCTVWIKRDHLAHPLTVPR